MLVEDDNEDVIIFSRYAKHITDHEVELTTATTVDEAEEVKRANRSGRAFAILMLDLDHFKRVNDTLGHQAGDDALRLCADTLQQQVREVDLAARYGGEKFVIILTDIVPSGARIAAERIRQAIESLPEGMPTTSIGIAEWQAGCTSEELVSYADEALYRAKESGRNRVCEHEPEKDAAGPAHAPKRAHT